MKRRYTERNKLSIKEIIDENFQVIGFRAGKASSKVIPYTGGDLYFTYEVSIPAVNKVYLGWDKAKNPLQVKKSLLSAAHRKLYPNLANETIITTVHNTREEAMIALKQHINYADALHNDTYLNTRMPAVEIKELPCEKFNIPYHEVFTGKHEKTGNVFRCVMSKNLLLNGYKYDHVMSSIVRGEAYAGRIWSMEKKYPDFLEAPKTIPRDDYQKVWVGTHVSGEGEKLYIQGKSQLTEMKLDPKSVRHCAKNSNLQYKGYRWTQLDRETYTLLHGGVDETNVVSFNKPTETNIQTKLDTKGA